MKFAKISAPKVTKKNYVEVAVEYCEQVIERSKILKKQTC